MSDKYRISKAWRILGTALGISSFALLIIHFCTDGIFNWFEITIVTAMGTLFLFVAARGKSPKWLEGDLKIFPEED
jgi:hypothetical protein